MKTGQKILTFISFLFSQAHVESPLLNASEHFSSVFIRLVADRQHIYVGQLLYQHFYLLSKDPTILFQKRALHRVGKQGCKNHEIKF